MKVFSMSLTPVFSVLIAITFTLSGINLVYADSAELQKLKQRIIQVNQELSLLEKELLYPNTEMAIYVSTDVGTDIRLTNISIRLDGELVTSYVYDEREYSALSQGGIDRIYTGNVTSGSHQLSTIIKGYNPRGGVYEVEKKLTFVKSEKPAYIEIKAQNDNILGQQKIHYSIW